MTLRATERARHLLRKLSGYAAAAASLSFTQAGADIVHTDFGPEGILLPDLDFNGDGQSEFDFRVEFSSTSFGCSTTSSGSTICGTSSGGRRQWNHLLQGVGTNRVIVHNDLSNVRALALGDLVAADQLAGARGNLFSMGTFFAANDGVCEFGGCPFSNGDFTYGQRGFVGVLFHLPDGGPHTGWADIENVDGVLVLYSFAFETEPGKPIAAGAVPEPPSLLLLAAGAAGLAMRRCKRATRKASSTLTEIDVSTDSTLLG